MTSGACTSHKVVRKGEVNPRALARIEKRTSEARGLTFQAPVSVEAYTREESAAWIAQRYSGEDRERSRTDDVVAHRLGILPDGISLSELFRRTLTQNAAGIYRPREKTLFIVTDLLPGPLRIPLDAIGLLTGTDWNQELILSHELVHALQDQNFDLDKHVLPGRIWAQNEDMALARKSIVESEANIVSQAHLLSVPLDRDASRNLLISYLALFNDFNVVVTRWMTPGLPSFYAKLFVEQYTQGMRFVQAATNRGGWGTLSAAYSTSLPRSTEQMMFPSKYFGREDGSGVDEPVPLVSLSTELPPALEHYVVLEENVFGALLWRIYMEDYIDGGDARRVSTGWGGDRYTILEERLPSDPLRLGAHVDEDREVEIAATDDAGATGENKDPARSGPDDDGAAGDIAGDGDNVVAAPDRRSLLLWRTQWDTEKDAEEFFRGYSAVLLGKYPKRAVVTKKNEHAFTIDVAISAPSSGDDSVGVRTRFFERAGVFVDGARVLVVEGARAEDFDAVVAFAWQQNRVDEEVLVQRDRGAGIYAAPPPPARTPAQRFNRAPQMPLAERVMLPHHRAVFRAGMGAAFDPRIVVDGRPQFNLVTDRELRWGFRQSLEWTPPFVLSLDVTGAASGQPSQSHRFVQTVVTGGLLDFGLGRAFGEDLVLLLAPVFAVTERVGVRGLSLVAQGRVIGDLVTHAELPQRATAVAAASVYVAPFAFTPRGIPVFGFDPGLLVLSFGAGVSFTFDDVGAQFMRRGGSPSANHIVLGAATTRGFVPQPTVELRVLDGVHLYEMTRIFLDPTSFDLVTHEHVGGLLLRF